MNSLPVNTDKFLFKCILLLAVLYLVSAVMSASEVRQLVTAVGSVFFYVIAIRKIACNNIRVWVFFPLFIVLAIIVLGVIAGNTVSVIGVLYAALNFYALLIVILVDSENYLCLKEDKWILAISVAMSIVVIIASQTSRAYVFEDGRMNGALALGMTNSNMAGMMIFCIYSLLIMQYRKNRKQYILIPLLIVLFYLLWLTKARSSLLSAAIVTVYGLFFYKRKIPNVVVIVSIILPVVIVPLYMHLFKSGISNFQLLGKSFFSGREITYSQHLDNLTNKLYILFGNLSAEQFSNAHNAPLTVMCSIGVIGAASVYLAFLKRFVELNRNIDNSEARAAIVCVLCIFIQSSAEALMFTGHFSVTPFIYIFVMMICKHENDCSESEEKLEEDTVPY